MATVAPTHDPVAPSLPAGRQERIQNRSLPQRAITWTGYALFAMAVAYVCAGTLIPALLGYHATTVYGGSMGATLPSGSVAITETVGVEDVAVGDVVAFAFEDDRPPVMHRVVAIEEREGQRVATLRGDSNGADDPQPLVLSGRGDRLVYDVPFLGYILHYSRTAPFLVGAAGFLAAIFVWERIRSTRAIARE